MVLLRSRQSQVGLRKFGENGNSSIDILGSVFVVIIIASILTTIVYSSSNELNNLLLEVEYLHEIQSKISLENVKSNFEDVNIVGNKYMLSITLSSYYDYSEIHYKISSLTTKKIVFQSTYRKYL